MKQSDHTAVQCGNVLAAPCSRLLRLYQALLVLQKNVNCSFKQQQRSWVQVA